MPVELLVLEVTGKKHLIRVAFLRSHKQSDTISQKDVWWPANQDMEEVEDESGWLQSMS